MSAKVSCFFAYPSEPLDLAETIEKAIEEIKHGRTVVINGWKSTSVSGKFIMLTICEAIAQRDIFVCDLTNLNHNVLFELGYAIAKKKRIWILLNPSIQKSKADYEKFKVLTTVGYSSYTNSYEITTAYYEAQPYNDLESTIYKEAIESVISARERPMLLYLRSGIETDASVKLARRVDASQIPSIVDDPHEVRIQPLSWYAQKTASACAVITHFLSTEHTGWRLHNAKNSLVSGLAYGFEKPLLMLAHEPYDSPIDYRELLKTHSTAKQCESLARAWLDDVEYDHAQQPAADEYVEELRAHLDLQKIAIGDPVAENESETLSKYFVRTAAYNDALASKHSIFIGRKGSGKTAILYKLASEIRADRRNHVCIIKPIAYELEGILSMLRQALPKSEKGYLVESFWKYLIYTELAKSVFEVLKAKPAYYAPTEAEEKLLELVQENASVITPDFSIRLESVVSELEDISDLASAKHQRLRISELLHDKLIPILRSTLGEVLKKKNKVAILIDNLDKAWTQGENLVMLSDLLFGLLEVSQRVSQDFERSGPRRPPVNLSVTVFLRSDIFAQVVKYARERDKISYSRIAWDDQELLLRVLEERFLASTRLTNPRKVWSRFFCTNVKGIPTAEYLNKCILPRPRDLLYLSKAAIAQAVNRRHTKVEEEDIVVAQKKYSQYVLDSILVENSIEAETFEALLYEFLGLEEVVYRNDILRATKTAKLPESKLDEVIELLCDLTFLGREVEENRFEFLYNEEDKAKFRAMARKTAQARADTMERFRINDAFHEYLEIKPVSCKEVTIDLN